MSESLQDKPEDAPAQEAEAVGEALEMSNLTLTSSNTSSLTRTVGQSKSPTGETFVPTHGEPEENPPSSSTSTSSKSALSAPRVDRNRVLRWQVQYETNGGPQHDDRTEQELWEALCLHFGYRVDDPREGADFKLIRLRIKE